MKKYNIFVLYFVVIISFVMEHAKKVIVVPVDFSEVSDVAIGHAIGIAKQLNVKVSLLHILDKKSKVVLKKQNNTVEDIIYKLTNQSKELSLKNNVEVDFVIKEGGIFTLIPEVVKDLGAMLVVMGVHGKKGIQYLLGSYALKVITGVNVPTITVQKGKPFGDGYDKIVVPLDNSDNTRQKFKWAVFVSQFLKSELHVVIPEETDEFAIRRLNKNLGQVEKILKDNEVNYLIKQIPGKGGFAKKILNYSKDVHADLLMIMTAPDQLMAGVIFDSAEEPIINNKEQIPVMCVNPKDLGIQIYGM